jgi:hypothetical protein
MIINIFNIEKLKIDLPLTCEFVNDIAVGGFSLSDSDSSISHNLLCVWITSNCGMVSCYLIIY